MSSTSTQEVPVKKVSRAKKVTATKGASKKRSIYCTICEPKAGPFKSKIGLAIHNGKPDNVATHMPPKPKRRKTKAKGVTKVGNADINQSSISDSLVDTWMNKALQSSKLVRQAYMDCALDLKTAFKK